MTSEIWRDLRKQTITVVGCMKQYKIIVKTSHLLTIRSKSIFFLPVRMSCVITTESETILICSSRSVRISATNNHQVSTHL